MTTPDRGNAAPEESIGPCMADPAFHGCVRTALDTPELVANFDRLYGFNLSRRGAPVDILVDDTTGRTEAGIRAFMVFVRDYVYTRLPADVLADIRARAIAFAAEASR